MDGLLNELNPDDLRQRFSTATPFPSICIDNFLEKEFADAVHNSFPSFEEVRKIGRGFNAVNERGKFQLTDAASFPDAISKLHQVLASPDFLEILGRMSGYDDILADEQLVGGGVHQTGPRGHLDVHVDFNFIKERKLHRRLNILVFFNKDWREEWGGRLELWDDKVKTCHHSFLPLFNRCVIFETSDISYHGVTAVTCPEDYARKSFAAYYYTQEPDANFDEDGHSTIFRARPNEHIKRTVFMPLERLGRWVRNSKSRLRRLVK